jgi:hypothetical protein
MENPECVKHIKNKAKRQEVFGRIKKQKAEIKKVKKEKRKREVSENPDAPKKIPRTLENTRETDETGIQSSDEEVARDEDDDEFRAYFDGEQVHPQSVFKLIEMGVDESTMIVLNNCPAENDHHHQ